MKDFWRHMDEEYLDYHALSRSAIAEIKSLDRKDSRFLQIMHVKLNHHRKNLDTNNMGHRITSDEMINEHWVPLLTEMAKEDWIKRPKRDSPLWPQFEAFLENVRGWDLQHPVGNQLMTAKDASPHITIPQTARNNSVFSASHGKARMMNIENRETRRRKTTPTITSAAIDTHLTVTQEQKQERETEKQVTRHKSIKRVGTYRAKGVTRKKKTTTVTPAAIATPLEITQERET
jgi:hypothetical protein